MSEASHQKPNLLCIGAPKCGTSWLAVMLSRHPQIFIPAQKELNVLHYEDCHERLDEYEAYFSDASEQLRGDFSVRYLASANAVDNAAGLLGDDLKLLCLIRDPVEQMTSHYWHLRRQNFHQAKPQVPVPDLLQALEMYPELLGEPVLYNKHLKRWLAEFSSKQLLVVQYRDLADKTSDTLASIQKFLNVDQLELVEAYDAEDPVKVRRGVQPRGGMLANIYPAFYAAVTQGPYRWFKNAFGVQRAERWKRNLRLSEISQSVFFEPGYPPPSELERSAIEAWVRQDQIELKQLLSQVQTCPA